MFKKYKKEYIHALLQQSLGETSKKSLKEFPEGILKETHEEDTKKNHNRICGEIFKEMQGQECILKRFQESSG